MEKALVPQEERAVTYQAADGQEVRLTPEVIKKYLVQGKSELVTTQELMYFLNICKARRLNPLVKDCYLVKYSQAEGAAIITSVDFFRKRARAQKDCKGWKKGVLVRDKEGKIRDSFGLVMEGETLVGGWFEAMPEGWLEPFRLEVNLRGYLKKTNEGKLTKFWSEDNQPTMIAKVAEAQGLRCLWPDEFQQIYSEDEIVPQGGGVTDSAAVIEIETETESFDSLIPETVNREVLEQYLDVCAKHFKKPVEAIKSEAAQNISTFLDHFTKWAVRAEKERQEKARVKQQDATPEPKAAEPADEMPERFPCAAECAECPEKPNCPTGHVQ